jgi:hypothetical protein
MTPSLRLLAARGRYGVRSRLPWIVGAIGPAALCAGVLVLFATEHEARSTFLLTLGVALLLVTLTGQRLQLEESRFLTAAFGCERWSRAGLS